MVKDGLVTVDIGSLFGEAGICEYCDRETLTAVSRPGGRVCAECFKGDDFHRTRDQRFGSIRDCQHVLEILRAAGGSEPRRWRFLNGDDSESVESVQYWSRVPEGWCSFDSFCEEVHASVFGSDRFAVGDERERREAELRMVQEMAEAEALDVTFLLATA